MKAIGSSNAKTIIQFVSEAVTLTVIGLVVGIAIGILASAPVTNSLVSSSTNSSQTTQAPSQNGSGQRQNFRRLGTVRQAGVTNIKNVKASLGWGTIGYGVGATLLIAVVGSALPAYFISKVRPAEVMRAE
jgi:putative ABC transport system permease protein